MILCRSGVVAFAHLPPGVLFVCSPDQLPARETAVARDDDFDGVPTLGIQGECSWRGPVRAPLVSPELCDDGSVQPGFDWFGEQRLAGAREVPPLAVVEELVDLDIP